MSFGPYSDIRALEVWLGGWVIWYREEMIWTTCFEEVVIRLARNKK